MLRMPEFEVHLPTSPEEAVRLHAELPDAMFVAGGTDLLPNLKHQLHAPKHLVSLSGLRSLVGICADSDGSLVIGAGTPLQDVADSALVQAAAPALAAAAGLVAGPQHRRMGTLGGNVMLDTRCLYYNQSAGWRNALGYCLKKDGDWCHVIDSPKRCVAAQSADTVPVLLAIGASLDVLGAEGPRKLELNDLYAQDGRYDRAHTLERGALLTAIRVPPQPAGRRSVYRKVRARDAVDFPQLALALVADFDGGVVTSLTAVVGALLPKPKTFALKDAVGTTLDDETIERVAQTVFKRVAPQTQLHGDPAWRRHMASIETRRGLMALRDG